MTVFAEQYDFTISLLLLDDSHQFSSFESEIELDAYDKLATAAPHGEWQCNGTIYGVMLTSENQGL
jgi:hypothetical protein